MKEWYKGALAITKELGDRKGEATCYRHFGLVFHSVEEYHKAKKYHEEALVKNLVIEKEKLTLKEILEFCFIQLGNIRRRKNIMKKRLP